MSPHTTGWMIGIAALGMMAGLLGTEIASLTDWSTLSSPAFLGKVLVHAGAVVGAFVGGKIIPTSHD